MGGFCFPVPTPASWLGPPPRTALAASRNLCSLEFRAWAGSLPSPSASHAKRPTVTPIVWCGCLNVLGHSWWAGEQTRAAWEGALGRDPSEARGSHVGRVPRQRERSGQRPRVKGAWLTNKRE